jgi:hypothetical protein
MGTLAFVCPVTGESVFTDLDIDSRSYSSIAKNRLSQLRCPQCGEPHELAEVVSWLAEDYETPSPEAA